MHYVSDVLYLKDEQTIYHLPSANQCNVIKGGMPWQDALFPQILSKSDQWCLRYYMVKDYVA